MKNKKGLSAIVATLIIILLVLVAVGIVWMVVQNIVKSGAEDIDIKVKCIDVDLKATIVDCTNPTACDLTLSRGSGGDVIGGAKIVFYEGETGGSVIDVNGDIAVLGSRTLTAVDSGFTLPNVPNKIEVTVYFVDDAGIEKLCPNPSSFNF